MTQEAPEEFAEWVAARGGALQRFAYLTTGSADDAADLVQEALARAFPRWAGLTARGTAEAYVRRSIVNASISRWRKEHRTLSGTDREPAPTDDSAQALADSDQAWRATPRAGARIPRGRRTSTPATASADTWTSSAPGTCPRR